MFYKVSNMADLISNIHVRLYFEINYMLGIFVHMFRDLCCALDKEHAVKLFTNMYVLCSN